MPKVVDKPLTNKQTARLLTLLADRISKVPEGEFEMKNCWAKEIDDEGRPVCGTVACALGWGSTVPALRKRGLRLSNKLGLISPLCGKEFGVLAGVKAFGITEDEAVLLFVPWAHDRFRFRSGIDSVGVDLSRKAVILRIRNMARNYRRRKGAKK